MVELVVFGVNVVGKDVGNVIESDVGIEWWGKSWGEFGIGLG